MGTALVGVGVRQHARPESISKRAPSTTRTSLGLESITCEQSEANYRTRLRSSQLTDTITFVISDLKRTEHERKRKLCKTS